MLDVKGDDFLKYMLCISDNNINDLSSIVYCSCRMISVMSEDNSKLSSTDK